MNKQSKKVVIVDDDPVMVQSLMTMLELNDYQVSAIVEPNGVEEVIVKEEPDLILLDIRLDNRDGRMVARNLRNNVSTAHIPIVIISANPEYREYCFRCGADEFIEKPFSISHILEVIKSFTTSHRVPIAAS